MRTQPSAQCSKINQVFSKSFAHSWVIFYDSWIYSLKRLIDFFVAFDVRTLKWSGLLPVIA